MRYFLPKNLWVIVANVLPKAVLSSKLMTSLDELCQVNQLTVGRVLNENFIKIYADIYINESRPDIVKKCEIFFEKSMEMTIHMRLRMSTKKTLEETLPFYNQSPKFVMEVLEKALGTKDPEEITKYIHEMLLCVMIYFELLLASPECERVVKKNVLLSLGHLIRMLGAACISPICFKIITLLKAAVEQTDQDLSEFCIQVWDILIRICHVKSLGPILSTIFVSLETFIDKYPDEVNGIYKYLIEDNTNLLSCHISNLFFIKKTRANDRIKRIVSQVMESQKLRDEADFRSNLQSLIRHMNSENSDLKIRVYCLQYITELFENNRDKLNEMICSQMSMDPLIEDLLRILVSNCKTTSSEILQLATAECLGELGAIEPSLQQQNYASQKEFPKTIHSEEFSKMALDQLCRSYQYKNDSRYIDALSLAIQSILKASKVTMDNRTDHVVWQALPEKMRSLLEPLITSSYIPKQTQPTDSHPIFLNSAQTSSDWAMHWAGTLIVNIPPGETRLLLESLKPSMKHNQYTTSIFLPFMLLHSLELSDPLPFENIVAEIQFIFNVMVGKNIIEKKNNERKPLFVKSFDFEPIEMKKKLAENDIKTVAMKIVRLIFEIFDFLENYVRTNASTNLKLNETIKILLNSFDLEEMAQVNYECGEYARALIYLEAKMKTVGEDQQKHLPFLTRIFAKLGSVDSVQGVQALKTSEWSLKEKILITNITGSHQDSVASCERLMQIGDEATMEHVKSMVSSYIALDQPETALLVYENMVKKLKNSPHQKLSIDVKAEPLWRLSRFDELDALLSESDVKKSTSWGVQCGKMLLKFRADDDGFFGELRNVRFALMKNLKISGSEQTAYGKNYQKIINLHLIAEFEKTEKALEKIKKSQTEHDAIGIVTNLIGEWNARLEFVEKNGEIEEPILGLHRIILNETKTRLHNIFGDINVGGLDCLINGEISNLWMQSTKLACKNKMYQQAQIYILNAEQYKPKELFLEKAKLSWLKNDQNGAFKILEMGVKEILGNNENAADLSLESKKLFSKGKMMIARYNAEAMNVEFETNKKLFKDAKIQGVENEKLFLLTADYMDRHYSSKDEGGKQTDMTEVMRAYYNSMICGNESVFQSMPRFLSIWLDKTAENRPAKEFVALNKLAEKAAEGLNPFYFYTAFSQLISRIGHPLPETFTVLKKILVKLIHNHPQQSLWFIVPMLKSSNTARAAKCKEILNGDLLKNHTMQLLIKDFNSLIDKFISLSFINVQRNEKVLSIQRALPALTRFLEENQSRIMIPFQSNLQLIRVCKQNTFKFNDNIVMIHKVKDKVDVMPSLQKPRKVTLVGNDGKEYPALFKPNDDCRIDQRFMEFSSVLKEFLHKDAESRRRQLTTRTYCVIPLNEKAGFIGEFLKLLMLKFP
jgi:serine/threonine-protein kinase ATR